MEIMLLTFIALQTLIGFGSIRYKLDKIIDELEKINKTKEE